jgi:hypothetical protein
VAVFSANGAPGQLWLFRIAPMIRALVEGVVHRAVLSSAD